MTILKTILQTIILAIAISFGMAVWSIAFESDTITNSQNIMTEKGSDYETTNQ